MIITLFNIQKGDKCIHICFMIITLFKIPIVEKGDKFSSIYNCDNYIIQYSKRRQVFTTNNSSSRTIQISFFIHSRFYFPFFSFDDIQTRFRPTNVDHPVSQVCTWRSSFSTGLKFILRDFVLCLKIYL